MRVILFVMISVLLRLIVSPRNMIIILILLFLIILRVMLLAVILLLVLILRGVTVSSPLLNMTRSRTVLLLMVHLTLVVLMTRALASVKLRKSLRIACR